MFMLGRWTVDPMSREVTDGSAKTRLSPKALGVLMALDKASGQVVSRGELLDDVWAGVTVGEEVLTHAIAELRRAFDESARDPKVVETVHRAGYRLRVRSEPVVAAGALIPEQSTDTPKTGPARPEIKQVTILMADLGPALADVAADGPEAAEQVINALAEKTAGVAHRYGGTITDRLNDRLVVAFGAPVSIEDPVRRAADAALALLDEAEIGLVLRLALSSGEVVQRPGVEGRPLHLSGLPLSLAAEILAATPSGRIRLDDATQRRGASALQVLAVDPPDGEGGRTVYELKATVPVSVASSVGQSRYVSRRLEMQLLQESADEVRAGRGRIVAVSGEAGIGKSRLFREFLSSLPTDEWLILEAAAPRGEATPFRGAARMLTDYLAITPADDAEARQSKLSARLTELGNAADLEAPLATLLFLPVDNPEFQDLAPPRRLERIEGAIRRLLALEAARRPVALVIEDLHWIDPRSEAALNALLPMVSSVRILALLNYRPDHSPGFLALPAVTHRRLDALSTDAERQLLDNLIGSAPELESVRASVAEQARGNPLFVEEIVSSLLEKGVLEGSTGACRLGRTRLDTSQPVPASIKEILAARVDRLPSDQKELLLTCAAIGPEARRSLVGSVSALPDEQLRLALDRLMAADLLRQDSREADTRILFKHAMTHEVAYAGLHSEHRQQLHRRIAEAMEDGHTAGVDDAPKLAEHWTAAGAPARAIPYWQETGRAALYRSANRSAVRYFEAALALIPEVPDSIDRQWRELELSLALGVALVAAEGLGSARALEVYARAEALAVWLGSSRDKFIAQWGLHHNSETREAFPRAVELTYRMADTAREAGDPTLLLQADHASWATRLAQGRLDDVLILTARSGDLYAQSADHGDAAQFAGHDPHACAQCHSAIALCIKGDPKAALLRAQEALNHASALHHPTSIAHALMFMAKIRFLRDEPAPLSELCGKLAVLSDEHCFLDYADTAAFLGAWADWRRLGRVASTEVLDRALGAADRLIKTSAEVLIVPAAAELRVAGGDLKGGLARIDEALDVSRKTGVALVDAELNRVAARLLFDHDGRDAEIALARLEKSLDIAKHQGAEAFTSRTLKDIASFED